MVLHECPNINNCLRYFNANVPDKDLFVFSCETCKWGFFKLYIKGVEDGLKSNCEVLTREEVRKDEVYKYGSEIRQNDFID